MSNTIEHGDRSINERISGVQPGQAKPPQQQKFAKVKPLGWAAAAAMVAVAGVAGTLAFQKYAYQGEPTPQAASSSEGAESAAPPSPAADDLFAKHAGEAGAKLCTTTYSALGKVLTNGSRYTALTETSKADADKRSIQGIVGMAYEGTNGAYAGPAAGVVFAAPVGQNCEGNMVRVVPFGQNCEGVVGILPKGSTPISPLGNITVYQLPMGGQAVLIPSGSGCTVMSILRTAIQ